LIGEKYDSGDTYRINPDISCKESTGSIPFLFIARGVPYSISLTLWDERFMFGMKVDRMATSAVEKATNKWTEALFRGLTRLFASQTMARIGQNKCPYD
jgi:hypothetical protein